MVWDLRRIWGNEVMWFFFYIYLSLVVLKSWLLPHASSEKMGPIKHGANDVPRNIGIIHSISQGNKPMSEFVLARCWDVEADNDKPARGEDIAPTW